MVEIKQVETRKQLKEFVKFPYRLYGDCPQWVPDLMMDELDNFTPAKNPLSAYCESRCFLAYKDGELVGRVAGIISHKANEKWGTKRIRISRLDFIDDLEVSRALIDAVAQWGRAEGLCEMHGPIGFCDLDQEGMLVEGFEHQSMFFTIYNYPYYVEHMEKLGFVKDVDWIEYKIKVPEKPVERLEKLKDVVVKRCNLKIVAPKNKRELRKYIRPIFDILNEAYGHLYGTVPLTKPMVDKYVSQFILLLNVEYLRIIVDKNDKLVGFGFGIPSLSEASKKSNGKLFPFGWYRLLRAPYRTDGVFDLYLVAVLPEMQKKGLTAVLLSELAGVLSQKGIAYAETGPELELNENVQAMWKMFDTEQHKRRRCWLKTI